MAEMIFTSDKNTYYDGDTITILFEPGLTGGSVFGIQLDGVLVEEGITPSSNSSYTFQYVLPLGEHIFKLMRLELSLFGESEQTYTETGINPIIVTVIEKPTGSLSINNKNISSLTIGNKEVYSITANESVIFKRTPITYSVSTDSELTNALINAKKDDTVYIEEGTYNLEQNFNVSGITITGDENVLIKNTGGAITASDLTVHDVNFEGQDVNRSCISLQSGNNNIYNCEFKCDQQPWSGQVIGISGDNPDGLTEIHDCYFYGNGNSTGYGHAQGAILGFGATIYNILIHHNRFNHPKNTRSVLHGGYAGKAVCFYNENSAPSSLINVHLYCNQYLGEGDTNVYVSEETCPD